MSNKRGVLAFLVGQKNALKVVQYIGQRYSEISQFKVVVTMTEGKELDALGNMDWLSYVASLKDGGAAEIAKRCSKKQLQAVFILNPNSIVHPKQFPAEKLMDLFDACWSSNTFVCVNMEAIDLVLNELMKVEVAEDMSKATLTRGKPEISKATQRALLTRFPTFDLPLDEIEIGRRSQVGSWATQQLAFWLESNSNTFLPLLALKFLFDPEKKATPTCEWGRYWTRHKDVPHFVQLSQCPLEESIKLFTIGPGADLRRIWDIQTFQRDFLITHHVFMTSLELLKQLRKQFKEGQPEGLEDVEEDYKPCKTVLGILSDWILMEYGSDFQDNDDLVEEMEDFIKKDVSRENAVVAGELQQLLETAIQLEPPYPLPVDISKPGVAPKSLLPKKLKMDEIPFFSLAPLEIARQMTLMDESLFHRVRAKEFLGGAWTKKDAKVRAPNLTKFIEHTNRISSWVVTEILSQKTKEGLEQEITFWIKVGQSLLELRNYNGVMNILTSLHSATIGRLRQAWAEVKKQDKEAFDSLTESLSLLGHYKNYREELKTLDPSTPVVPLIAVTCSDLNGLGEVLENVTPDGWINWDKHSKFAEHIWSVKRFMRARYIFKAVPEIQTYIQKAHLFEGEKTMAAIAKLRDEFCTNEDVLKGIADQAYTKGKEKKRIADTELSDRDWHVLSPGGQNVKYKAGDIILDCGIVNNHLIRIRKGVCEVQVLVSGKRYPISSLKAGSMFGEMSLLLRGVHGECPTTAAIFAETEVEITKYPIDYVLGVCQATPLLSERLNKVLSVRLAERLKNFKPQSVPATPRGTRPPRVAVLSVQSRNSESCSEASALDASTASGTSPILPHVKETKPSTLTNKHLSAAPSTSSPTLVGSHSSPGLTGKRSIAPIKIDELISTEDTSAQARKFGLETTRQGVKSDRGQSASSRRRDKEKEEKTKTVTKIKRSTSSRFHERQVDPVETEFSKLFKVKSKEPQIVIKTFSCAIKSTVTAHGTLYITPHFLCFTATTFGRRMKEIISILNITRLDQGREKIEVEIVGGKVTTFKEFGAGHKEAWNIIYSAYQNKKTDNAPEEQPVIEEEEEEKKHDTLSLSPTDDDWKIILEGTRAVRYTANQPVVRQEQEQHQRIFQIAKGKCRIEKYLEDGSTLSIASIGPGAIFGEISFLEGDGGKASASVVADEDDTTIHIIEGFFLDIVFEYYPGLSGRFYHYLAQILSGRLKEREEKASATSAKTDDEELDDSSQSLGATEGFDTHVEVLKESHGLALSTSEVMQDESEKFNGIKASDGIEIRIGDLKAAPSGSLSGETDTSADTTSDSYLFKRLKSTRNKMGSLKKDKDKDK